MLELLSHNSTTQFVTAYHWPSRYDYDSWVYQKDKAKTVVERPWSKLKYFCGHLGLCAVVCSTDETVVEPDLETSEDAPEETRASLSPVLSNRNRALVQHATAARLSSVSMPKYRIEPVITNGVPIDLYRVAESDGSYVRTRDGRTNFTKEEIAKIIKANGWA